MVLYIRKWVDRIKFIFMFSLLTFVLYHIFMMITAWIEPTQKYKEPAGRAVKAFQHQHVSISDTGSMKARLKLFYWYGE